MGHFWVTPKKKSLNDMLQNVVEMHIICSAFKCFAAQKHVIIWLVPLYESVGRGFESLLAYHFQPGIVKIPGDFLLFYELF